jgi:hypothetical protein
MRHDARQQHRALPHATFAVEDGQRGGIEIRGNDALIAFASEEIVAIGIRKGHSMADLTNLRSQYDVRGLSDEDLCGRIGELKPDCGPRVYAEAELAKRFDKPPNAHGS